MPQQSTANILLTPAAITAAATILGVIIGFLLNFFRDWRKDKKKLKSIRKIFFKEMKHNYSWIIWHMPPEGETDPTAIKYLAGSLNELPSSVYDNLLDRLPELTTKEVDEIYKAYTWIKESNKIGAQAQEKLDRGEVDKLYIYFLVKHSEATLKAISMALQLLKGGKETLDSLQKERGARLEAARKLEHVIKQAKSETERSNSSAL